MKDREFRELILRNAKISSSRVEFIINAIGELGFIYHTRYGLTLGAINEVTDKVLEEHISKGLV